jgi:hypothetical protein
VTVCLVSATHPLTSAFDLAGPPLYLCRINQPQPGVPGQVRRTYTITIGVPSQRRLLIVAHTDRNGRIRIISAREATKKEERFYAETE